MLTYLALGDSYTVGEQVPIFESFPYQLVQRLRSAGKNFAAAEIVAKTGFTTGELLQNIEHTRLLEKYDLVTLLIGVNNQYRSLPISEFENDFKKLIHIALDKSGGQHKNVFVVSIPDWGFTPFAADKDQAKISEEIDEYNGICKNIAKQNAVDFIDITSHLRLNNSDENLLAADRLHYSGKTHEHWAQEVYQKYCSM